MFMWSLGTPNNWIAGKKLKVRNLGVINPNSDTILLGMNPYYDSLRQIPKQYNP